METETITYEEFTLAAWNQFPKDYFPKLIKRWCERHRFISYVEIARPICTRLPYRLKDTDRNIVEVATDFLDLTDRLRAAHIFQPVLPVS